MLFIEAVWEYRPDPELSNIRRKSVVINAENIWKMWPEGDGGSMYVVRLDAADAADVVDVVNSGYPADGGYYYITEETYERLMKRYGLPKLYEEK